MRLFKHSASHTLRRAACIAGTCWVLLPLPAAPAPTVAGTESRRDDIVQARQFLMDAIDEQVAPLDRATAGQKADLTDLKERAYLINILMAAFPHLFPDGTRPAEIPDDGTQTSATDDVWNNSEAFYGLSKSAAAAAYEASQATDIASLRIHATELRQTCDACHMGFMASQASPPAK